MRSIIVVASGKGGVGKSTVAVNLAVSLAKKLPNRVALVDVDFYGPSVPTLMGGGQVGVDHEQKFIPANKWGVKFMSIAFFLKNADDPVVWRGPMFGKAINQLFGDANWGSIDICIVDMPPGTGDAQISITQQLPIAGALMVTTPQEVALTDVRRAIQMFRKVNVEVFGIVENMSGLKLPSGEVMDLFGSGGGEELSRNYHIPLLAKLPIEVGIRESGDKGTPIAADPNSPMSVIFDQLAQDVIDFSYKPKAEMQIIN